jgi:hypothetical protein
MFAWLWAVDELTERIAWRNLRPFRQAEANELSTERAVAGVWPIMLTVWSTSDTSAYL